MRAIAWLAVPVLLAAAAPARAASKGCVEQSDVTGDRLCSRYGSAWSTERTPPISLAMGFWSGHVEPRGRSWVASTDKGADSRGVSGAALGLRAVDTFGMDFRFVGHLSPHVYLGMDTAFAFATVSGRVAPTGSFTFRDRATLDFVHMRHGMLFGSRIPLGRLALRVETLVGFDVASYALDVQQNGGTWLKGSVSSFTFLFEPRVAAELWTSPWATTSIWVGRNFFHPDDHSMGIQFAIHGRSFDGRFSL